MNGEALFNLHWYCLAWIGHSKLHCALCTAQFWHCSAAMGTPHSWQALHGLNCCSHISFHTLYPPSLLQLYLCSCTGIGTPQSALVLLGLVVTPICFPHHLPPHILVLFCCDRLSWIPINAPWSWLALMKFNLHSVPSIQPASAGIGPSPLGLAHCNPHQCSSAHVGAHLLPSALSNYLFCPPRFHPSTPHLVLLTSWQLLSCVIGIYHIAFDTTFRFTAS